MVAFNEKHPNALLAACRFFDVEKSAELVASVKWPSGACCPDCGSVNVGKIVSRAKWQCREKGCRRQFSLITDTIMEASHLRLDQWVMAVWMIANCRNGVSSCEIARHIGCKQQSAWHLLHRVRHLLQPVNDAPFRGTVEVDETFVSGALKWMSEERRQRALQHGHKGKTIVFGMYERLTGQVRAAVIPAATLKIVREQMLGNIEPGAEVHSDSARIYDWSDEHFEHQSVNHGKGEYVRGNVTINALEGFFNCLRRGLKGTYIAASPEHLTAYVNEQVWRFNNRKLSEWDRFKSVMSLIVGKRLEYSTLTDGCTR